GHSPHSNGKMGEIGGTYTDGLDFIAHGIEHFPKILKMWDIRKHFHNFQCMWGAHIYIAQSNNIGQSRIIQGFGNSTPSMANPATSQIYFIAWRNLAKRFS